MLRRLLSLFMAVTPMLILVGLGVSCSTAEEVKMEEILAAPQRYEGQRVLVRGRFHTLVHIALDVDWYWSAWVISDGTGGLEVYLMSDECLIWDTVPDYEEDEEIRLAGVVSTRLLGSGRSPSVCLLVNVEDVDIETSPLTPQVEPESLVGRLIGGTGEVVSVDGGEGRSVIETADGVTLDGLPPGWQSVGPHVRFAGTGCVAGDTPQDAMPIHLYYVEMLE